ncbi:exopolyphosphatase [Thermomonas alba]|uniref:exopolyphosphatase n=1 Tax=Thermomonas alba TaxID=2888525 RepID=UPI001F03AB83|nr:exopolyphosphatase [Thermomonas alba]
MPATAQQPPALRDGDFLAAVDLGSNSFHIVVAQRVLGQLRVLDRLRETVRLAEGLNALGGLDPAVRERALACLARFGQRVADIPRGQVRAVATHTVRQLRDPESFLRPAEAALGHPIDVISGREEARLVYLGVAHEQPPAPDQNRLVIDIGGGSTECIIGRGFTPLERESLQVGCIASTRRFFPGGKLGRKRWQAALTEVELQFQQFAAAYRRLGWDEAIGTSGTHKALANICAAMKLCSKGSISREGLSKVRERLLQAGHIEEIELPGLSDDRRPVIAGGVLVLEAAFAVLGLEQLQVSKAALREGVLYDLLGRGGADDPRELSVAALMQRYGVDAAQAQRVQSTTLQLFDQVEAAWALGHEERAMLAYAARLHELGLAIAHSGYHVHGAYILEHSDIAGFSQQDQRFLAALVRCHRRSVPKSAFEGLPDRLRHSARRCAALLRLAVLLHRARKDELPPGLRLHAEGEALTLSMERRWLHSRPLLRADLEAEPEDMLGLGIQLRVVAA